MVQLPATAAIEYVAVGHFFPGGLLAGERGFCPGVFCPGALLAGGFLSGRAFVRGGGLLSGGLLPGGTFSPGVFYGARAEKPQFCHKSKRICRLSGDITSAQKAATSHLYPVRGTGTIQKLTEQEKEKIESQ